MRKQQLLKSFVLTVVVTCMFLLTACDSNTEKENTEQSSSQNTVETEKDPSTPVSSTTENEAKAPVTDLKPADTAVAKINGGADETGIYSIVVRLTDQAADKGVIEMVYYGTKGSPQENSVVSTFRIEYYKESSGTYEIQTFFDNEVDQNLHHKDEMKVVNTFGANLRAGNVIITYKPDGGDSQEIFKADADYFYCPEN